MPDDTQTSDLSTVLATLLERRDTIASHHAAISEQMKNLEESRRRLDAQQTELDFAIREIQKVATPNSAPLNTAPPLAEGERAERRNIRDLLATLIADAPGISPAAAAVRLNAQKASITRAIEYLVGKEQVIQEGDRLYMVGYVQAVESSPNAPVAQPTEAAPSPLSEAAE